MDEILKKEATPVIIILLAIRTFWISWVIAMSAFRTGSVNKISLHVVNLIFYLKRKQGRLLIYSLFRFDVDDIYCHVKDRQLVPKMEKTNFEFAKIMKPNFIRNL